LAAVAFRAQKSGVKVSFLIGRLSMLDRREGARDKVIFGGGVEVDAYGATRECTVGNISDKDASVAFSNVVKLPREQMSLRIARKGRCFLAKAAWWRDNFVGLAFSAPPPSEPVSDLEERLRKSEIKKRQLQRRIKKLLDER
jgi:hypothetical protein